MWLNNYIVILINCLYLVLYEREKDTEKKKLLNLFLYILIKYETFMFNFFQR